MSRKSDEMADALRDWQTDNPQTKDRMNYLFKTKHLTDVSFIVGEGTTSEVFAAHKLFLIMSSPVFEAMFYGPLAEESESIKLPDVDPEGFRFFLKYIYTEELSFPSVELATKIFYIADKYLVNNLLDKCSAYINANITHKITNASALQIYEFAKKFSNEQLLDQVMKYCCQNVKAILAEESFLQADITTVGALFEQEKLNIPHEMCLIEAAGRYLEARKANGISNDYAKLVSKFILRNIRFLSLLPKQFANCLVIRELLTQDECYKVLMNISSSYTAIPMPPNFNEAKVVRNPRVFIVNNRFKENVHEKTVNRGFSNKINMMFSSNVYFEGIEVLGFATCDYEDDISARNVEINVTSSEFFDSTQTFAICRDFPHETDFALTFKSPIFLEKNIKYIMTVTFTFPCVLLYYIDADFHNVQKGLIKYIGNTKERGHISKLKFRG